MGIDVTGQLNGPPEIRIGDPAVGQPEALGLACLARELPQYLESAGIHHLGEERRRGRYWAGRATQRRDTNE